MKHALLLILAGLIPLGAGCRTVRYPSDGAWADKDQAMAEALAYYAQGLIHEAELGWHADATLESFARAAERVPDQYRLQYNMALALFHQRRFDEAITTLERFSRRHPEHLTVRLDLAAFANVSDNQDDAIRHYRAALAFDPPDLWLRLGLARLLFEVREDREALAILAAAWDRDASHGQAIAQFAYDHARLFLSNGEYERASTGFELIASRTPQDRLTPTFLLQRGAAYERSDRFAAAETVFLLCLQLYPRTHEVLNYLAYMWAEQGRNLDQALVYVLQALEQEPENGAYVDTLGWIYYQMGRFPKALEQLKKANRLMPNDPTVTDHVGDAYHAVGDRENALLFWKKSHALDPNNAAVAAKLAGEGIRMEPTHSR